MRIPRIYLPAQLATGAEVELGDEAVHHLVRVLRLRPGAPVRVFNGEGGEYAGTLTAVERRRAAVRLEDFVDRDAESSLRVTLAQAVGRGERMDYTLQKAVELGVAAVQPLLTARTVVNLAPERVDGRLEHWRGVVAGACQQCGRNRLPAVARPVSLSQWLVQRPEPGLVLDPEAGHGLARLEASGMAITLVVGPEGGLDATELQALAAAGFQGVRLGPRVLRTETAGVAALAAIQTLWGDLAR